MAVSRPQLTSPRAVGVACAVSATALGLLYLNAAGAPARHLIVNALSLVLGLAIFAVIPPRVRRSRASGAIVLALGIMLLATAMFGISVDGASRWIRVGGMALQISLIVLPAMLVAFARSGGILSTAGIVLAALGLALQPDRAMSGIVVAALVALAVCKPDRQVIAAFGAAAAGFAFTLFRPDSLPAVPYVDQILYTSFDVHPLIGVAVVGGALLLTVPALVGLRTDPANRAAHAVFGVTWLGMVAAAALGNYPTPLLGYGGSAILGYALSLSFIPLEARAAASANEASPRPPQPDITRNVDLRVSVELG